MEYIRQFLNSKKEYVGLIAVVCGFYPLVFYYSNNYFAINTLVHLSFFIVFFIGLSLTVFLLGNVVFKRFRVLEKFRIHFIYFLCFAVTSFLLSQAMFLTIKKKLLLVLWFLAFLSSFRLHKDYKKVAIFISLMCIIPVFKIFVFVYEDFKIKKWQLIPEDLTSLKFKEKPNIYLIQPDGYVNEATMKGSLYNYNSDLYDWLRSDDFEVYDNFRSNYSASLISNASMFAMKHHRFDKMIFPSLELPDARDIICGDNNALKVLNNNGYQSAFIIQDEYFLQNGRLKNYNYTNLEFSEIPFFSNDNYVKKDVFKGLKEAMKNSESPKFYFIEKLLPHHVHFIGGENSVEKERLSYIQKIEEVNLWLKRVINYIENNDRNCIIIVMADHGGWVGLKDYSEFYSTNDEDKINSIFSSLLAIKWNGHLKNNKDLKLNSNVNLFRVLFSVLTENKGLLKNMEDNSSYNIRLGNSIRNKVSKCIDNNNMVIDNN